MTTLLRVPARRTVSVMVPALSTTDAVAAENCNVLSSSVIVMVAEPFVPAKLASPPGA